MPAKAASKPVAKKAPPKAVPKKGSKAKKPETPAKSGSSKPAPSLFEARPKNWGLGQDLPPKRDLTRYVKWPKYVKRQRQKRVLQKRLHVPPAINQFNNPVDRHTKKELIKFALKYKPESRMERRERLKEEAKARVARRKYTPPKPRPQLKQGIQRITRLVEQKRAKLVMIAHDVEPIEVVLFLPALCKKMEVPYCIVKGKANLGKLVGTKKTSTLCFLDIAPSDKASFDKLCEAVKLSYNDRYDDMNRKWGGLGFSRKSRQMAAAKKKKADAEAKF